MKLHPKLQEKLDEQQNKYELVTAFAEKLPIFADNIIDREITGAGYAKIAERFGKLPLNWGINWQVTEPTNYPKEFPRFTGAVCVYINCCTLFGDKCAEYGRDKLSEVMPNIKVFFYDSWNTTFYFKPEEVKDGLSTLEKWYIETCEGVSDYLKQERKKQLEQELAKLG